MSTIANIGYDLGLNHGPIRRLVFCLTTNDSGTANVLSLANAAAIANWRTKFNTYNFAADTSVKFVATPLVYEAAFEDGEPTYWEIEDYRRTMRQAPSDMVFSILDPSPYILKNLSDLEDSILSVFFITSDNKAIGIKDGTDLKPIPIQANSFSVPYYKPAGYDVGSQNIVRFRLSSGADRNSLVAVTIADGSVTDVADFFSLRAAVGTVASPATTGCQITTALNDVNPSAPGTVIRVTGIPYTGFTLTLNESPGTVKTLASAGSLTEVSGVYTINESALLTSGKSYILKVSISGYDIVASGLVTVP
jgi:hypothetical protein